MKKKLSILIVLVMAISLCLSPVAVSAAGTPTIDGVINAGEWDGALWFDETLVNTFTIPQDMPVKIYITNDTKNLYIALDIPDTYDMRPHPEVAEGESDTFSLNIGVQGEGRSYSRILQFNTTDRTGDPAWFVLDGYFAQWAVATSETNTSKWGPDVAYGPIPAGVQSATVFDETHRVQEISILLSDLGVTPGTVIRIGGCIRAAEFGGYNFHAKYPVGLDWGVGETYKTYELVKAPVSERAPDAFDVFVRFGYDSTRYGPDGALISSIEAMGEYNDTRYMLEIPKDCVVTGKAGRINWLWLAGIDGAVLSFVGGDASFSEPCTLYITDGGRLYQDYWTGEWLGGGKWVEVGSFTAIKDGEAHLD